MDLIMNKDKYIHTIAVLHSYLGAPFCGFARQNELITVQGELENALKTIFKRDIDTVCAGRTDTGVHAKGQVISFDLYDKEFNKCTQESLKRSLNALTHDNICIKKVVEMPVGFSARFDADWREYRYRIADGSHQPLFTRDFSWWVSSCKTLDIDAMKKASSYLIGEHDFKSFCVALSAQGKNTVRDIKQIEIYKEELLGEEGIVIKVIGNAFLHSMIRTLAGTLVEVGCKRRKPEWILDVLNACDRSAAGQKAPAQGLVFWHVQYKLDSEINDD